MSVVYFISPKSPFDTLRSEIPIGYSNMNIKFCISKKPVMQFPFDSTITSEIRMQKHSNEHKQCGPTHTLSLIKSDPAVCESLLLDIKEKEITAHSAAVTYASLFKLLVRV